MLRAEFVAWVGARIVDQKTFSAESSIDCYCSLDVRLTEIVKERLVRVFVKYNPIPM